MKSMRLLIDTNIILDWLTHREQGDDASERIMESCILGENSGYVSVHSLTNLFYILRKDMSAETRMNLMDYLCTHLHVVAETNEMVKSVIDRPEWKAIEDGLQMQCAISERLDCIVTRNIDDFIYSDVSVIAPQDFVERYLT